MDIVPGRSLMASTFKYIRLLPFGLLLAAAAWIRFWAVPLSSGPDVAQFWGFAELFRLHGLDFYRVADGQSHMLAHPGWAFVYPPMWLLILGGVYLLVPDAWAATQYIDIAWRWAEKTPIIIADLAIGVLLYRFVPGAWWKKLIFSGIWLLSPMVWYQSAIFGQFDAIAAALMFSSFLLIEKGHDRWGFAAAGLAVMTKQHTLIPLAFMFVALVRNMSWKKLLPDIGIFCGVIAAVSIPFLVTGNIVEFGQQVLFGASSPGYQVPLPYAFSGTGATLTWLHDDFGWNTLPLIRASIPILVVVLIGAGFLVYRRRIAALPAMLIGVFLFMCLFYRINYQYLVIYMPLALLLAARTRFVTERVVSLIAVLYPIGWLWMFGTTLWFQYHQPVTGWVAPFLESIGLSRWWGIPDSTYALYTGVLTAFFIWYVIGALTRWRDRRTVATALYRFDARKDVRERQSAR